MPEPETFTVGEVKEGQDYALIVFTPAGAWRYMIGDTVKFTNLQEMEIVISGRTKYFLNVVGAQLSEENERRHTSVEPKADITINEFVAAAIKDKQGDFYHHWVSVQMRILMSRRPPNN